MKLADFRMFRWNARHQLKWKTTLGLWAVLIGSAYTVKVRPPEIVLIVMLVGVVVFHGVYVLGAIIRTQRDMDMAFYYSEHAERTLMPGAPEPRARRSEGRSWSQIVRACVGGLGETVPTIGLAVAAYFLIGHSN